MSDITIAHGNRMGPRPLGFHLALASLSFGSSFSALRLARSDTLLWAPELQAEAEKLQGQLAQFNLEDLATTLGGEGQKLLQNMMSGITKYQAHPYRRHLPKRPVIWSKGSVSLLDCSENLPLTAPVIFLVPSLVNKSYILDLMPERSFVTALAKAGIRPLLVDWGTPGAIERDYSLDTYILDILVPAFNMASERFPKAPLHLAGYCMGGTLAVALAQIVQGKLSSLITIAAPWDFHEGLGQATRLMISHPESWRAILQNFGELPVDVIQTFFASLDPNLCLNKFGMFNRMDPKSSRAETFVALEDWLNDGVPLVRNVAFSCFTEWYGDNRPASGSWFVGGEKIDPHNITIPSMIVVPKSDKIVPPASARSLAGKLPNASLVTLPSGHIGMVVGSRAKLGLWANVLNWVTA